MSEDNTVGLTIQHNTLVWFGQELHRKGLLNNKVASAFTHRIADLSDRIEKERIADAKAISKDKSPKKNP